MSENQDDLTTLHAAILTERHVTPATAALLKAAGWLHTLEPGDWVQCTEEIALVTRLVGNGAMLYLEYADGWRGMRSAFAADCLHLPTAEQLLRPLLLFGDGPLTLWAGRGQDGGDDLHAEQQKRHQTAGNLAELAALAWLQSDPDAEVQP